MVHSTPAARAGAAARFRRLFVVGVSPPHVIALGLVLMIALTAMAQPALALSYLSCATRKVVMIVAPSGDTSSTNEEEMVFVLDEAAKTLAFSDNRPLTITRLSKSWLSANRDDVFYEFNRQDGSLTYASSTTQEGVTTTIVGAGQCAISPAPRR